jgi:hypothetical protein
MNENVWDPVTTWQAPLPGSMTECPQKLPKINLSVPGFLSATSYPETSGQGHMLDPSPDQKTQYPWLASYAGSLGSILSGHTGLKVSSVFLLHPLPINGRK